MTWSDNESESTTPRNSPDSGAVSASVAELHRITNSTYELNAAAPSSAAMAVSAAADDIESNNIQV